MSSELRAEQTATFTAEGLHARPAAEIVKISKQFSSSIEIVKGARTASARSSLKLMLLGVQIGESVTIRAQGADAGRAVQTLVDFIASLANAPVPTEAAEAAAPAAVVPGASPEPAPKQAPLSPPAAPEPTTGRRLTGTCGSSGSALGPVFLVYDPPLEVPTELIDPAAIETERARLELAVRTVVDEFQGVRAHGEAGAIVEALVEVASDADLRKAMLDRVGERQHPVAAALQAGEAVASEFARLEDPYLRARADDVRAVARRVAGILCGQPRMDPSQLASPSILVAPHLGPWDLARLPAENILGILTAEGGVTSHVAIIARSLGVPALVGVTLDPKQIAASRIIALDADQGVAILDPDPSESELARRKIAEQAERRRELDAYRTVEPRTRSGRPVTVAANVGSLAEIERAKTLGAMGVGLFRTELLFMERGAVPSEDKQAAIYEAAGRAFPKHRVVIRTLDIGGDKIIPGVVEQTETNPFLGWRGIRMCLDRPDLFKPQLRALLRAAVCGNLDLMFPMISDKSEILRARAILDDCARDLAAEGRPVGRPRVGIMVETPAAALCAADLAQVCDFFSIGTNDLTQYVMAADRMNPRLTYLSRADHPAVLAMVEMTCRAAHAAGIGVAVCGEAASNTALIPILVAMGVDELSMSAPAMAAAKRAVTDCP